MKRTLLLIIAILLVAVFLAGCVRTTTYVRERLDQAQKGNRGYIQGEIPPYIKERKVSRTRTLTQIEIELPPYIGWERYGKEDKEIWGNRGNLKKTQPENAQPEPERKYTK